MSHEDESSISSRSAGKERRLVTILHADVHGYSRRIHDDEAGTLQVLTPALALLRTLVEQHGGRAVGSRGDSLLAEFPSVVEAVQCAVEMQRELKEQQATLPEAKRLAFRMGINLGEIVIDGDQPHGDGINIAVRIEGLAEPGGICISDIVYHQVKTKLPLQYRDLGEQQLKDIPEAVRVWRIVLEESGSPQSPVHSSQSTVQSAKGKVERQRPRWASPSVFVVVLGGIAAVRYLSLPGQTTQSLLPNPQPLTPNPQSLPLPDKPSIVVLPFTNMSGDPEQEYFSDGITEDITTDLSKIASLFVIARNSAFSYKGQSPKVQEVSRELGVRYVLEGSVRKADNQVRITAQLIDATTGGHLWSERYDRPLKDIFALQDEIRQKIVFALKVKLTPEEQERFKSAPTNNLEAYDYFLRGVEQFGRFTKEANAQAQRMFEKAIELDPQYAAAYALQSSTYVADWVGQWSQDRQILEHALVLAQKALALNDSLPTAYTALGFIHQWKGEHDQAIASGERAIALDPNNPQSYVQLARILAQAGRAEEGIARARQAMRLNPHYPPQYMQALGFAYHQAWRNDEAIATFKRYLTYNSEHLGVHLMLTCSYSDAGRDEEARAQAAEVLRLNPNFTIEVWKQNQFFKDTAERDRHVNNLRKAGLK